MRNVSLESFVLLIILTITIIPIYSVNTEINQEYKVKIGDTRSYSVLEYYARKSEDEITRERNRSFTNIFGEKHYYFERKGTSYTYKIIHVNNSGVYGDVQVNNLLIEQIIISKRIILSATTNQSYFEESFHENSAYTLNGKYLSKDSNMQSGYRNYEEHYIWDITTGWLESHHFILRGHTEIEAEYLLKEGKKAPSINFIQFLLLIPAVLGIGIFMGYLYERKKERRNDKEIVKTYRKYPVYYRLVKRNN